MRSSCAASRCSGRSRCASSDEFVRHKILDIVGDLALFGGAIKGHVIAVKPGPRAEHRSRARAGETAGATIAAMPPSRFTPKGGDVLDVNDVMKLLPHRYPFLMVDRIVEFEGETKCTGVKNVTINEPFFQGHFPGHPVMPGVLQLEAMAQVGSILPFPQDREDGQDRLFHERGCGEIPQAGGAGRHALHRGGGHAKPRATSSRPGPLPR